MDEILDIVKKYPKTYIITVSIIATILIVNETLNFAERIINNTFLGVLSIIIFYFFVRVIIENEKIDKKQGR